MLSVMILKENKKRIKLLFFRMKFLNFDLFTKFQDPTLTDSSKTGGIFTILVFMSMVFISFGEIRDAYTIKHYYEYLVDPTRSSTPSLQINIDMTVNMPCQYVRMDVLDVSKEIIMLKNKIQALDVRLYYNS